MAQKDTKEKKAEKVKLTPVQAVQVWNLLNTYPRSAMSREFYEWAQLLGLYLQPEVERWGKLTQTQREYVKNGTIEFQVEKIAPEYLPEVITSANKPVFDLITSGKVKVYESQIDKLLTGQEVEK